MADETIAVADGTDGGIAATDDGGAGLQEQMTGDFFDDGVGSFIDTNSGAPLCDENGNKITTEAELAAFKERSGAAAPAAKAIPTQTQKGKPGAPAAAAAKPTNFDSMFHKAGNLDFDAVGKQGERFSKFAFQSQLAVKPGDKPPAKAPETPPDPKTAMKKELETLQGSLTQSLLTPIKTIYEKRLAMYTAAGQQMPREEFDIINEQYIAKENQIKEILSAKQEELQDGILKGEMSKRDAADIEKKAMESYAGVAGDLFPDLPEATRKDRLDNLIFGWHDGKTFIRGYGADHVESLFENACAYSGKTFTTVEEKNAAMNSWWARYASNPVNVRYVARAAFDRFQAQNYPKYRDAVRAQYETEQATKQKFKSKPGGAAPAGAANAGDSASPELDAFFSVPKQHL